MAPPIIRRPSDHELVARAATGDPEAARLLDARFRRRLTRYARSLLGRSHHDAEDVVQDVLVKAIAELGAGHAPRDLEPWLLRLTRNRAIDEMRRARWGEASLDDPRDPTPSPAAAPSRGGDQDDPATVLHRRETIRSLVQDLADLPVAQRDAILTRVVDGASPQESAERLGVSVEAVQMLVVRARANLERVRALRHARGDLDRQLMALASPGLMLSVIGVVKVASFGGPKLVAAGIAAVVAVAAAGGLAVVKTEHHGAGEAAPFTLSGAGLFVGHRVVRGQTIPDGTAVVATTVKIAAGDGDRSHRFVTLQCPAGMRFATLLEGGSVAASRALQPSQIGGFHAARADGKVAFSFPRTILSAPQTIRIRVLCRKPGRGGSLLSDPRLPQSGEGHGEVCHEDYVYRDPEHLFVGSVFRGQRVTITRRASRSAYVITDDRVRGWLKTASLCPGWKPARRTG